MSRITREARWFYAFAERNFNLVKRCWTWEVAWMTCSIVNVLSIALVGKTTTAITGQVTIQTEIDQIILYLLLGTLTWYYLAIVLDGIGQTFSGKRMIKTFKVLTGKQLEGGPGEAKEEPVFGHVL